MDDADRATKFVEDRVDRLNQSAENVPHGRHRAQERCTASSRHRWTEDDDLIAFYLSPHGTRFLAVGEAEIATLIGLPQSSLTMRKSNFAYLDGERALSHASAQSRRIHGRPRNAPEAELRRAVFRVLESVG